MASETERAKLTEHARDLLNKRPRTLTLDEIHGAIGLHTSWLSKFGRGEIVRPKLATVQLLREYLLARR